MAKSAAELYAEMRNANKGEPEIVRSVFNAPPKEGATPPRFEEFKAGPGGQTLDDIVKSTASQLGFEHDKVALESAAKARAARSSQRAQDLLLTMRQEADAADVQVDANPLMVTSPTYKPVMQVDAQDPMGGGDVTPRLVNPIPTEPDSEAAIKHRRQMQGVRFDKGAPFFQRLRMAQESGIPSAKSHALRGMIANLPDDVDIQWDPLLEQWYFPMPITQADVDAGREDPSDIGKYRYTAFDEDQFSFNDLADMVRFDEALALVGSMYPAGKVGGGIKMTTTGLKSKLLPGAKEAGAAIGLGTLGRLTGDAYRVAFSIISSNGDWVPTREELINLGWEDAQIELVAGLVGEALSGVVRKGATWAQDAYAVMTGRQGVYATEDAVADLNRNIDHSKQDLNRIRNDFGETDYQMTEGEATGSIDILEKENSLRKNQRDQTKRNFEIREHKARAAGGRYATRALGGDEIDVTLGYSGVVNRANESFANHNVVVASIDTPPGPRSGNSPGQTRITFTMKDAPEETGLRVMPSGREGNLEDGWQVVGASLPDAYRNTGVIDDLYQTAAVEARAHNKRLMSDATMSEDAIKVWERQISKGEEFAGTTRLPDDQITKFTDGEGRTWYQSVDGSPIYKTKKNESLTPTLLSPEFTRPTLKRAKDGGWEVKEPSTISGVFRGETSRSRKFQARMWDEINNNHFIRRDVMEEFYNDYRISVFGKDGKIDTAEFLKWKRETAGFADRLFTPEELLRIKRPGGLEAVLKAETDRIANLENSLRRTFKLDNSFNFKDPGKVKGQLWDRFTKLSSQDRRRAMVHLNEAGMAEEFRGFLFRDISGTFKHAMNAPYASQAGAEKILKDVNANTELIYDMFPGQKEAAERYIGDLRTIARTVQRRSISRQIKGTRQEANPNMLALTRVVFGPLSRAQRFLTAARRVSTRRMGENAINIIQDPENLRKFMQLKDYPVGSRQAAQLLTHLGFADAWGDDLNKPEVMADFISWINDVDQAMEMAENE